MVTKTELLQHIRATAKPQAEWGKKHGVPQSVISSVLTGKREAPESLLSAMGLRRVVSYEPAPSRRKAKP